MTLRVKFTDLATGSSRYQPGDVWKAQDGPGRPWWETMVPRNGKWYAIGRDLDAEQVKAIADCVDVAIADCKTHKEAKEAARLALEAAGLWDLVQAQA